MATNLSALGLDFDMVHTQAAGEAIQLARQAVDDGYDTIVAVGGDGTANEVVNGLMARPTACRWAPWRPSPPDRATTFR
jgi:diacylglycerol kinase family enzyme